MKRSGRARERPVPEHKAVPGTSFCVDSLAFDAGTYFVTHAHSDHYGGLSDVFRGKPIYCSECTARVLLAKFPGLSCSEVIRPLPMRQEVEVEGVKVTLVDANHCPGAVQFIFSLKNGDTFIHSGDMRYHVKFKDDPLLRSLKGGVTTLYLDTTYCNPKYVFPTQQESIDYVTDAIGAELESRKVKEEGSKPLFLISTYSIGKEKILKAVAKRFQCKIFVSGHKMRILSSLQDPELDCVLTTEMSETCVHVVRWGTLGATFPYFQPNFDKMEEYRRKAGADTVQGFVPTGWMYEMKKQKFRMVERDQVKVHLVPYSEHSNFEELRQYVEFLRPEHVIPTVGVNGDEVGKKSSKMTDHFKNLMDETASKRKFIQNLSGASASDLGEEQTNEKSLSAIIPDAPMETVRRLLSRANGNVEVAVTLYFDMSFTSTKRESRALDQGSRLMLSGQPKRQKKEEKPLVTSSQTSESCKASQPTPTSLTNFNVEKTVDTFSPEEDCTWGTDGKCPYIHVANALFCLESTKKRLRISDILTNMFRAILTLSPCDLLPALYLTLGKIAPDYMNVELSIGGSTVAAAISEATGVTRSRMSELYKKEGDLGNIAHLCKQNQRTLVSPKPLLVRTVYQTLKQISEERGAGSAKRKKSLILKLMTSCRGSEIKYLTRTLVQNLRVGASRISILSALGRAASFHFYGKPTKDQEEKASESIGKVYAVCPNLDIIVDVLLSKGLEEISRACCLIPGVPVKPMLAKTANGIAEAVNQVGEKGETIVAEYKYDGMRAQIHRTESGDVKVFSRNCEDRTEAFPDVVEIVESALASSRCTSIVLDAEIVAIHRETGEIRSFQDLSTRGRKGVDLADTKNVSVCVFVFDLLFHNGEALITASLQERLDKIETVIEFSPRRIESAKRIYIKEDQVNDAEQIIGDSLALAWNASCEGLMLKWIGSSYEPDKRSNNWLKLKRDYCQDLQDSLDLVPIGAWYGNGRKAGWYSPILLAAWNPDLEQFESVCRCLSGFSDEFYKKITSSMKVLPSRPSYYETGESPSVWFEASEVWEIVGADFTVSPVHQAGVGLVDPSKGISVRFPRFIRCRPEKNVEDATTNEQIAQMYLSQTRRKV